MFLVVGGADDGIKCNTECEEERKNGNRYDQNLSFDSNSSFQKGRREMDSLRYWVNYALSLFLPFLVAKKRTNIAPAMAITPMTVNSIVPLSPV